MQVGAIWMVGDEGVEESTEKRTVRDACTEEAGFGTLVCDCCFEVNEYGITKK
jgi:hypothetical protein